MQTFCFFFVNPDRVYGVVDIADPEQRRTFMLDLVEQEDVIGWSSLRIRGIELDRKLADIEKIFGFPDGGLSPDLIAGRFPGRTPEHVPTFSYIDPTTAKRLFQRLSATLEQETRIDTNEELARVYACFFDVLEEAARRERAVIVDANG